MRLTKANILQSANTIAKEAAATVNLPEKVLQFGTGVLLRGLPDYFIDKANKQGHFNGRIVIVKSTSGGESTAFAEQDGLFTQCIRGISNGQKIEEDMINASISRVLSAKDEWEKVLECAANPAMEIVISNTTEVGIQLLDHDDVTAAPPVSFPAKLLAFLYRRYQHFNADAGKGIVILPTELIIDNGTRLKTIVIKLAHQNNLPPAFIQWLQEANHFCNTLVDRIVPGKMSAADKTKVEASIGFTDDLMIISECYSLWAIETNDQKLIDKLSFSLVDEGVVIAPDINKFRELKLRLLNGAHTMTCGVAHIAGIRTVKEAMDDDAITMYIENLMQNEIAPQIISNELTENEASRFAMQVLDRFRNPHIEHLWLNISVQYSTKIKMRNLPILLKHYSNTHEVPEGMALGFAAFLLFMKSEKKEDGKYYGEVNGKSYQVQDDNAAYFAEKWEQSSFANLVADILHDTDFWGADLSRLPGFLAAVNEKLLYLINGDIYKALREYHTEKIRV